ncbi:hypothetical protein IKG54_02215 [Candidatus Saccharibacteria bacterium]|nr:hypothetical protein [Candidatus Saccharibacteria bacterium]
MKTKDIIFLGNGPLASATLDVLSKNFNILVHARTQDDLEAVKKVKSEHPDAPAVLASFGVIIKKDLLGLFESTGGIINIHPSLLPKYRGPSPIESAILNGDKNFGVSIMKLAQKMDAGPIYYQASLNGEHLTKAELYTQLAHLGADWLVNNLFNLPTPASQNDDDATYCEKLDRTMSPLDPKKPATRLLNEIKAFAGWPKSTYTFYNKECIIHSAHISDTAEIPLNIKCSDGKYLIIDELQPAGKKRMDAKSFLNGYAR